MSITTQLTRVQDVAYRVASKTENPLNGITPDFSAFGVEFDSLWKKLIAGVWGLAIIVIVGYLAMSFMTMVTASGNDPRKVKDSRAGVMNASMALAGAIALPIIVGAIIFVVG